MKKLDSSGYHITVGVDAQLVRDLGGGTMGIIAAMLYNLIQYFDEDENDGWGKITAKYFEKRTTFKKNSFLRAQQVLIEAGLIEKRVCCRPNTFVKYTQLRIAKSNSQNSVVSHSNQAGFPTATTQTEVSRPYNNKNSNTTSANCATHNLSGGEECLNELTPSENESPFGDDTIQPSVRPDKAKDITVQARRHNYAIASRLYKRFGVTVKPSKAVVQRINELLESGWNEEKIMGLAEWASKDEFYKNKGLISTKICASAAERYESYLAQRQSQTSATADVENSDEWWERYAKELMPQAQKDRLIKDLKERGEDVPTELL